MLSIAGCTSFFCTGKPRPGMGLSGTRSLRRFLRETRRCSSYLCLVRRKGNLRLLWLGWRNQEEKAQKSFLHLLLKHLIAGGRTSETLGSACEEPVARR